MSFRFVIHQAVTGRVRTTGRKNRVAGWRLMIEQYIGDGRHEVIGTSWHEDRQDVLEEIQKVIPGARVTHVFDGCELDWWGDPDKCAKESRGLQAASEYDPKYGPGD